MKHEATITAFAAWSLLLATTAHADPPESLTQITPRGDGSQVVALASEHGAKGLMYSHDGGKTFAALCRSMLSAEGVDSDGEPETLHPSRFNPSIITHDGHFIVGSIEGLWIDDGHGCNWQLIDELRGEYVSALTFDPTDPEVIYGVVATYQGDNGLLRIDRDRRVERIGTTDHAQYFSMAAAALPGGGVRIYSLTLVGSDIVLIEDDGSVTVLDVGDGGYPLDDAGLPIRGATSRSRYDIRYTDDFGATWTKHELEPTVASGTRIVGVDPTEPDRILIAQGFYGGPESAMSWEPDVLLVSTDAGATLRPWLEVAEIGAVSIAPDGTVFVGEHGESNSSDGHGLWRADSLASEAEKIADYEVWCLNAREDRLEVCTRFDWGTADPETGAFTEEFSVTTFDAIHTCEGVDSVAVCRDDLCSGQCKHWRESPVCSEQYPECLGQDALSMAPTTTPDAGTIADAGTGSSKPSSCSCRTLGRASSSPLGSTSIAAALAALLCVRRTRRARRVTR